MALRQPPVAGRFRQPGLRTGINLGRLERQPLHLQLAPRHVEIVREVANGLSPAEIAKLRRVTRESIYYVGQRLIRQLAQAGVKARDFSSAAIFARLLAPETFSTPEDNQLRDSVLSALAIAVADRRAGEP
jgi:DNA-binding CsgD family transcriptional regulator